MNRRDFLKWAGFAVPVAAVPWPSWFVEALAGGAPEVRWDRTLVLVELAGGNDGLNTVVPFAEARYREARPNLAIPPEAVLRLSETLGLHPALKPLLPSWEDKRLAIALGVGYPEPNRSHFRSIDIWETGSASREILSDGWLARLFAQTRPPAGVAADGVVVGRAGTGPLTGNRRTIVLRNPEEFLRQASRIDAADRKETNAALAHLLTVQEEVLRSATALRARLAETPPIAVAFPKNPFGRDLETVARLLATKVTIPVLKVSLGGFDTHSGQRGPHERLLGELAGGLAAFRKACEAIGVWDRLLVMTYSEFGRRVAENGSGGTDHGTAAPHFLLGGAVKGGFYGEQPSLADLAGGDLKQTLDYRALYLTVARRWWEIPSDFLSDRTLKPIDCL